MRKILLFLMIMFSFLISAAQEVKTEPGCWDADPNPPRLNDSIVPPKFKLSTHFLFEKLKESVLFTNEIKEKEFSYFIDLDCEIDRGGQMNLIECYVYPQIARKFNPQVKQLIKNINYWEPAYLKKKIVINVNICLLYISLFERKKFKC